MSRPLAPGAIKLNDFMKGTGSPAERLRRAELRAAGVVPVPAPRVMNKTETRYEAHLRRRIAAGEVAFAKFDVVRLRLAELLYYTPDFLVLDAAGLVELHEVKAYWKSKREVGWTEDSRVKIKAAAELFPFFRFRAAWEREGVWYLEEFGPYRRSAES